MSHGALGEVMLDIATKTLNVCPLATRTLGVTFDSDPEAMQHTALTLLHELDSGDGVLVLTDMFGATPSNVACTLSQQDNVLVVAGLNLPMLLKVFNYPQLELSELAKRAVEGGRQGVMLSSLESS
ncbi:MAG: PTS sugar transporter subunit IIA [Gammaproteobacteria bacterium]|nr:PTS sugar transporter subunit IIA [Gammaproteobacteria bacterium]MCF6362422.1 PTS sugar transporter subunit IIA [Gammaproteobacteria bacterium]